jgi:hypothetical protein
LGALIVLIDAQPYAAGAPFGGGRERGMHQRRRRTGAMIVWEHVHLGEFHGRSGVHGLLHLGIVADTANQHGVTDNPIMLAGGEYPPLRIGQILGEAHVGKVGVNERRDVAGCDRRGAGQRKGACGDRSQLGDVDGIRRDDPDYRRRRLGG